MAQTHIPFGSSLARKIFGGASFNELTRKKTFMNRLTEPPPKAGAGKEKVKAERMQTSPGYPCIRITDLSKERGDVVGVDLFNILEGLPVMGDRMLSNRMMKLKYDSMDIKINQARGGVDPGGRMAQQRTIHELRGIGRQNLIGWWERYLDQLKYMHMAGARGSMATADWVIPLEAHPEFDEIAVNTILPPTYNRHLYGGDATSIATLDTADGLSLDTIDRIRATIDEADMPLQPIVLPDDPASADEPLYVLLISTRQWHQLQTAVESLPNGGSTWRTFLMNARERKSSNPLFLGEPGMWNGILIRKTQRAIRFSPGDAVKVALNQPGFATADEVVPALTPNHSVDRALLMGAQALGEAWGKDSSSGMHMRWHEEVTDHGAKYEASVAGMLGMSKLRFKDVNGAMTDHGVYTVDTVAKDPRT